MLYQFQPEISLYMARPHNHTWSRILGQQMAMLVMLLMEIVTPIITMDLVLLLHFKMTHGGG